MALASDNYFHHVEDYERDIGCCLNRGDFIISCVRVYHGLHRSSFFHGCSRLLGDKYCILEAALVSRDILRSEINDPVHRNTIT